MSKSTGLSFAESAALLGIAAVLTGIVAPFVVQWATRRRIREQKQYEEDLARESAFISAQANLLEELGAALWAFQASALAVSYAGAYAPARLQEEWDAYDRGAFGLVAAVETQVTMAGTLFSRETSTKLRDFHKEWLRGTIDREISRLVREEASQETWKQWHLRHHSLAHDRTATLLSDVANDAGLSFDRRRGLP
jgi:hypothetical protein